MGVVDEGESKIKREGRSSAQVIVLEKSGDVSYTACGMSFNLFTRTNPSTISMRLACKASEITLIYNVKICLNLYPFVLPIVMPCQLWYLKLLSI
jgi:hypothetical protein